MLKRSSFIFIFSFCSLNLLFGSAEDLIRLQTESRSKNLAHDPLWQALLHYQTGFWGKSQSDIDGGSFFLSKNGRVDPQAELDATLEGFFEPLAPPHDKAEIINQHPRCRYPARYDWLNEKLHLDQFLPPMVCERYESWLEKIEPASVSLVFSGYYLNNPASMYGHTFLRIGRQETRQSAKPLLDYTANFAAKTDTRNGLAFAIRGLSGGYPGSFTSIPYYMKVQQYNNLESRDLWEYKLNLSQEAVDRMVAHLWEMGPTSISYYFFNKNCSYQLLPMLEVADRSLKLSDGFRFRAIPVDTLKKVLSQKGLVSGSVLRPSALRKMKAARDRLSKNELLLAEKFAANLNIESEPLLSHISNDRKKMVLEGAYELLKYRSGFYRNQPAEVQLIERRILLLMNGLPNEILSDEPRISEPPPPHMSHKSGRISLNVGADKNTGFEEISVRGALHDLEANPAGYVNGSQLEMLHLRLRFENKGEHLFVEEATAIQVKSLSPWEPWIRKPSWQLKIHFNRARDLGKASVASGQFGLNGGSGVSVKVPYVNEGCAYAMLEMDAAAGKIFEDGYRLGAGPLLGVVGALQPWWRVHFNMSHVRYGSGDISSVDKLKLIQAWGFTEDFEIRLILERQNKHQEGLIHFSRYF